MELGVVPHDLVLARRNEYGRSDVDGFWAAGVPRRVSFVLIVGRVARLLKGACLLW